jgi:hypothetical protein
MAAFASMAAAEARAKAKMADKTWVVAQAARTANGTICVRVQRYMNAATLNVPSQGGWVEITDDATV